LTEDGGGLAQGPERGQPAGARGPAAEPTACGLLVYGHTMPVWP